MNHLAVLKQTSLLYPANCQGISIQLETTSWGKTPRPLLSTNMERAKAKDNLVAMVSQCIGLSNLQNLMSTSQRVCNFSWTK